MKKVWTLLLSCLLIASVLATFAAAADTDRLAQSAFSFTVGLGTEYDSIGLPKTAFTEQGGDAALRWSKGNYNPQKEGTYTLTGTASYDGRTEAVTAEVTVVDAGFRLAPLPDRIDTRPYIRLNRNYDIAKALSVVPLVENGANDDFTWSYRWYTAPDLSTQPTLWSTAINCPIHTEPGSGMYYFCRVAATKNGVTKVLTTNRCYVQQSEDILVLNVTTNVDEVKPGDSFELTASIGTKQTDGSFDRYYYWTGAEKQYRPIFTFSCDQPGVRLSTYESDTTTGIVTVTVTTDEQLRGAESITIGVRVVSQLKSTVFTYPTIDKQTTKTIGVYEEKQQTSQGASKYYSDVTAAWAYPAVDWMKESGYMAGTSKTTFSPNAPMSRAMLVTTLYRTAGSPSSEGLSQKLPYMYYDVYAGTYYVDPVIWATRAGIANGTGKYTFSPDKTVTREEFAVMLYRMENEPQPYTTLEKFSDATAVSAYAVDALRWATANGYISGTAGRLNPKAPLTRAQAAVVLQRYLKA